MSLFFGGSASALLPETAWFSRREEEDIYLRPDAPGSRITTAPYWHSAVVGFGSASPMLAALPHLSRDTTPVKMVTIIHRSIG